MKIIITIKTDNAAFSDHGLIPEIESILSKQLSESDRPLIDCNGNKVGSIQWEESGSNDKIDLKSLESILYEENSIINHKDVKLLMEVIKTELKGR